MPYQLKLQERMRVELQGLHFCCDLITDFWKNLIWTGEVALHGDEVQDAFRPSVLDKRILESFSFDAFRTLLGRGCQAAAQLENTHDSVCPL